MSEPDRLEDVDDKGDYWSHSKLQSIFECGRKFKFEYLEKAPKTRGAALKFGSAVHKCLEQMHKNCIWEEGDVQRLWADTWLPVVPEIDWTEEYTTQKVFKNRGLKMLDKYKASHRDDEILALERRFKIKDTVTLGGIIDKIVVRNGEPAIVDYKTGKWPPDPLVLRADPQLTMYYMAAKHLGYPVTHLAIHNLLEGTEYWTTRSDADIDGLMESIQEGQLRIRHELYAKHIGYHCRTCPFKQQCLG